MRCQTFRALVILGPLVLALSASAAAQPAPSGPLFRIDPDVPSYYSILAVAADPGGGLAVAWVEAREPYSSSYTLRVRRIDAAGAPVGPAVALASFDFVRPEIGLAVGPGGTCLVVWLGEGLHGQFLDAAGQLLGEPLRLDVSHPAEPFSSSPHVATDPTGGFVVAWKDHRGDHYARRVRAPGSPPGPEVKLPISRFEPILRLAASRRGELAVVGLVRRGPDQQPRIFIQRLDAAFRPQGRRISVPVSTPSGWELRDIELAFGADESLVVAYSARHVQIPFGSGILVRHYTAQGRGTAPAAWLDNKGDSEALTGVSLAADPGGGFLVAWKGPTGMLGQWIELSGQPGPRFLLDPDGLGERDGGAHLVAQGDGRFVAVWASAYGILGQRFVSGSPGRLQLRLQQAVAPEAGSEAFLEVVRREGSRGEVRASWSIQGKEAVPGEDFDDTSGTVIFADGDFLPKRIAVPLLDDDRPEADESFEVVLHDPEGGASLGPIAETRVEIRDDDVPSPLLAGAGPVIELDATQDDDHYLCCPAVSSRTRGGFVAAWETLSRIRYSEFGTDLAFVLSNAAGRLGEAVYLRGPEDRNYEEPQPLPRPGGGFLLLWGSEGRRNETPPGRFGQAFGADGEPDGEIFSLPSFPWPEVPMRAAPAPDGGFVALGLRHEQTRFHLFAERHDAEGLQRGLPAAVNVRPILDPDEYRRGLGVAASAAGDFVVVWQRKPRLGTAGGIYARRFSPTGAPRGGEIAVGGQIGVARNPDVAVAPGGDFVVVWQSDLDGDGWGISARWFDAAGVPLGEEAQVNSSSAGAQERPRAAFGTAGDLLVLWQTGETLLGQLFAGPGVREGNEFVVDTAPGYLQDGLALAATGTAEWTALWTAHTPEERYSYQLGDYHLRLRRLRR